MTKPTALLVLFTFLFTSNRAAAGSLDFSKEILPILSNKCFICHGPDTRKDSELRLDSFDGATKLRDGKRAISPESPDKSEILLRIFDSEDPMPPKDAEKQLTEEERNLLSSWVKQGGDYKKHWAYIPPVRMSGKAIDAFIAKDLEKRGYTFAPEADPAILARRAALVLTGLPPEQEQLNTFLSNKSSDAYSRLIEDLMSSPRYGEHQARYWLDAIRYGDTHGLHLDNRRGIFPFRDWVVKALNNNLPLDKFIQWQLAGDLLPNPTMEQLVATGFVRMNPSTAEGGAIPEEFQAKNNFDRVETLGTVLLGTSLTCVRCHTHKYDPIPQVEYYRLMAFFNSTAEGPMDGNAYIYGPVQKVPENPADWDGWTTTQQQRNRLVDTLDSLTIDTLITHAIDFKEGTFDEWTMSRDISIDERPPEKVIGTPVTGFPGKIKDRLPKPGKARWISFSLTVPRSQTMRLSFAGGKQSKVYVNDSLTESNARVQSLHFDKGKHSVRLKITGTSEKKAAFEIRISNPWQTLAKKKNWSQCSADERLRMLADPNGAKIDPNIAKKAANLAHELIRLEGSLTTTLIAKDLSKPRETHLLNRGEYDQPKGEPLKPGILNVMGPFPKGAPSNRLGLAQWLTARDHPVVARTMINRIWQRIYGDGLVRTPEDFGLQGQQPTHPELLDWLAVELIESGWDLKHMLRLMLKSKTFKQDSAHRTEIDDPENRLFARGPSHRLDAEVLRDIALWSSGLLESHVGGEGVKPYQPAGMWKALTHPASNTVEYAPDTGKQVFRRSLYVYWKRTSPHPMMTLFDAPSRETSCVKRSRS
ncbi:PSD1 and planctomycete cytochrome C domain-containing protein, partial [Verrucomicrobia bacterium]|nr:PSD1 and planctomycete cytochrome C domain-containing protein [Verrucomicrobiota bacterium]